MIRYIGKITILTLVYALTLASFAPVDLVIGAILAAILLLVFKGLLEHTKQHVPPGVNPGMMRRMLALFPWLWVVFLDVANGTFQVLAIVLGIRSLNQPGMVTIPIGERSRTGVAVSGLATTLSPGTVLVDVDWDEEVMIIHAIDASDPDKVREAHQRMYDDYQRFVFP